LVKRKELGGRVEIGTILRIYNWDIQFSSDQKKHGISRKRGLEDASFDDIVMPLDVASTGKQNNVGGGQLKLSAKPV